MTSKVSSLPSTVQDTAALRYIAIVDDDTSVRRALARLIGAYSFNVQTYQSGRDFLDSLKTYAHSCLIVDLQMEDMTGLELMHRLACMGLRIPTIVVTARDEPGVQHRCEISGAVAFLLKPVTRDLLLKAIKAAMSATDCADAQSKASG
jgi:FixJ family two-component response regulator